MRITNSLWPTLGQDTECTIVSGDSTHRVTGRYVDTVYNKDGSDVVGHLLVTDGAVDDPSGALDENGDPRTVDVKAHLYVRHEAVTTMAWEYLPDEGDSTENEA